MTEQILQLIDSPRFIFICKFWIMWFYQEKQKNTNCF